MATVHAFAIRLWSPGGFPNLKAMAKALDAHRAAGMLRPSSRGAAAQLLDARECAVIALTMRGEASVSETQAFGELKRADGTPLLERLTQLVDEAIDAILTGSQAYPVTLTMCRAPELWAKVLIGDTIESYQSSERVARGAVRKIIEIPPEFWGEICEMAAGSARRTREKAARTMLRQGDVPGVTRAAVKTEKPGRSANLPGSSLKGRLLAPKHEPLLPGWSRPDCSAFEFQRKQHLVASSMADPSPPGEEKDDFKLAS